MILLDLNFVPLMHSDSLTWDEFLVLGLGIALIILVGLLGRRSSAAESREQRLVGSPNGKLPRPGRHLAIRDVSHRYGTDWALARVSLDVPPGQSLTILGPNGAGKSTLLHILATLIEPTSGEVLIGDLALQHNPVAIRQHVGLVSHKPLLYPYLTIWENLQFFGQLYNLAHKTQRAEMLLQRVQLWSKGNEPVRALSHGQRQRVAIARALMHNPDILLLDEPYSGLDLRAAEQLDVLLDDLLGLGHSLLITTHDLQRSLSRAGQVVILASGRLVYQTDSQDVTLESLQTVYRRTFRHAKE